MKRWAVGLVVVLLGVLGGWWWLRDEDAPGGEETERSANEGAVPLAALKSRWNDPITQRGSRKLSGVVLRDGQPWSGATITALAAHGDDVLSDLPCQCDNHCGQKLLACGCAEASGQLVELLGARTGESVPVGRATSGEDGTFTIEGLDESKLTLWADAPGVIGWVTDVASDASDVKLNVAPGTTMKGKVMTSKDTPASGALVTAIFSEQSRFFETTTRADGTFELGPMPKGKYAVVAMQEGLLPDHQQTREDERELSLELNVPRALSGVVMFEGKPVTAAKVKLEGMHRKRTVFTDGNGAFRIERLRPGEYDLGAEASGALGATKAQVNKREDREGVVIELARGVPLDGVVVDEAGAPVPGTKLSVDLSESDWARAESDDQGRFHIDVVPQGERRLYATHAGFIAVEDQKVTGGAPVTVTLRRAAVLSGRVQTADGVVVPEFSISAWRPDAGGRSYDDDEPSEPGGFADVRSTDGGFSLDLAPGAFAVSVTSEKFIAEQLTLRAPSSDVVITVRAGGGIRGTVFDADGAPLGKAMVVGHADKGMKRTRTDEQGRFELAGLAGGTWKLTARPDFSAGVMWSASTTAEVKEGSEVTVELRQPSGARVAGVVLDASGKPLVGARVSGRSNEKNAPEFELVVTDESGRFRLRTMPAGQLELMASADDGSRKTLTVTAPDENVILKLDEGTFISGRVVGEGGKVVKEFSVMHRPFDAEDGRFKLRAPPGKQHFAIDAVGYAQHLFDVDVKEGANELGDIKLSRGIKLTGRVLDAKTNAPIAGALVDVSTDKPGSGDFLSERNGAVRSDAQGRYSITIDPASTWAVASRVGYVTSGAQIPSGASTLDIPLRTGTSITASVIDAQGQPVREVSVWAFNGENLKTLTPSGQPGTFTGETFETGEWTFKAGATNGVLTFERLTVTVGESPQTVVLHEQQGGVDITFTTPKPVRMMALVAGTLTMQRVGETLATHDTTPIVRGVAKHVQPGRWTVLLIDSGQVALQPLEVTASGPAKVDVTPNWQPLPR